MKVGSRSVFAQCVALMVPGRVWVVGYDSGNE